MESNIRAQLTTMDTSVKTIMQRMEDIETKIETNIDLKFDTLQETLTNVITEKLRATNLVAQVAEVIGGENSPFVTSASLSFTMA
jgi:ACT domain-containing protein